MFQYSQYSLAQLIASLCSRFLVYSQFGSFSLSSLKPPSRPGGEGGRAVVGRAVDGYECGRRRMTGFIAGDGPFG